MKRCNQCRVDYEDTISFCTACGKPLKDIAAFTSMSCGQCGTLNPSGVRFCVGCGIPFSASKAEPKQNAAAKKPMKALKMIGIIAGAAVLLFGIYAGYPMLSKFIQKDADTTRDQPAAAIKEIVGEFYSGRAITLRGAGFGPYDVEGSQVSVDGMQATVLSWGETEITVCLPAGISKGSKSVTIANPPYVKELSVKAEFQERRLQEIARGTVSPDEDSLIEGSGVKLMIPQGSLKVKQEIVVSRYEVPVPEANHFDTVLEEFELTDGDGGHVFFDSPVFFGLPVSSEMADSTGIRYFDNAIGVWVIADTAYNPDDGFLYVKTTHFSGWQRFTSHIKKKIANQADRIAQGGRKIINSTYAAGKYAAEVAVELTEEAYVLAKDSLVEEFSGVGGEHVVVLYRVSDYTQDQGIRDRAITAAAAYDLAYQEYRKLFGEEGVPNYNYIKKVQLKEKGFFQSFLEGRTSGYGGSRLVPAEVEETYEDRRLKVFIDPRYNVPGANFSILSGSVSMPSVYPANDLPETCAHELFHAVQHHQLGLKMLYMANGLKEKAGKLEDDPQVTRYQANNKWFFEATAEFASLFIGTKTGISTLHGGIEANAPYYAFSGADGGQEYAMSAFLDYHCDR